MCTVLIIIGAYIAVPIGPVPIVLQNMFVFFAGLLLGPVWGVIAVAVYLVLGIIGLPVFAGGKGGFVQIIGPTGGYLLSYLPAVLACGYISSRKIGGKYADLAGLLAAQVLNYGIGLPWLKFNLDLTWGKTLMAGMIPFLPGAVVKIIVALFLIKSVRPVVEKLGLVKDA
jgi:biotin transport system substrate-specific component